MSSDIVASSCLVTSPDCRTTPPAHKALQSHVNLSLGRLPIPPGVVGLVAHVADGSTKSETTPATRHLPTSADRPWTRSSWTSDATAHAGYAMMMRMTKRARSRHQLTCMVKRWSASQTCSLQGISRKVSK